MINNYEIIIGTDTFLLKQNFNQDTNSDNIDVYDSSNIFIGEIESIRIPELGIDDEEDEDITQFEEVVRNWLDENYYNI